MDGRRGREPWEAVTMLALLSFGKVLARKFCEFLAINGMSRSCIVMPKGFFAKTTNLSIA